MFKKITKRDNKVLEAFKDVPKPDSLQQQDIDEPVVRKQHKPTSQFFSTRDTTEEFGKITGELNEDLKFRANSRLLAAHGDDATRTNDVDTSREADPRTKFLEKLEISKQIKEGKLDSKVYRGNDYYATYIDKSQEEISKSKFTGALGPIRAPTNIRTTSRIDVNPSLCKDWHVSGFCSFGDECIYIHDRGDYKSGWEMEQDWEAEEKKRRANGDISDEEDDNLESDKVPRICSICEKPFKNPVVTRCGHFFCESCALSHNQTSPMCKECGKPTNGILNDATKVLAKMRDEAEKVDLQKGNRQKLNEKKRRDEEDFRDDDGPEAIDVFDGVVIEGEDGDARPLAAKKEMKTVKSDVQKVDALDDLEKLNYQFKKAQNKKKGFSTSASDWLL